jgi:hypothetical protein
MEPAPQGSPSETYVVKRRVRRRRHRRGVWRRIALAAASLIMLPVAWKVYKFSLRLLTANPPRASSEDRRALPPSLNKALAETGKDIPVAALVVDSASLHNRDGKVYLIGAVKNRSSRDYARIHIVFDTYDHDRNPAIVVEGDVTGVAAQKQTRFEMGPVFPEVRTFAVRSIQPVE